MMRRVRKGRREGERRRLKREEGEREEGCKGE